FLAMRNAHEDCEEVVKQVSKNGRLMFVLQQKLKNLKTTLHRWNHNGFGNEHENLKSKLKILKDIQLKLTTAGLEVLSRGIEQVVQQKQILHMDNPQANKKSLRNMMNLLRSYGQA
ncbi:unnamed protein product, partial [Sphenostylis stenocarpa]